MAKANLALAYERTGDAPRARLAARQALGVASAPTAVLEQANGVLARLGPVRDDLGLVLAAADEDQRRDVVREEVVRWAEAPASRRAFDAASWIETQLAQPELAEPWLGALLELPPEAMEDVIRSVVAALAEAPPAESDRFRADAASAMVRFHAPQLERLRATFERLSAELGQADTWS
jgi:hypothetical protein